MAAYYPMIVSNELFYCISAATSWILNIVCVMKWIKWFFVNVPLELRRNKMDCISGRGTMETHHGGGIRKDIEGFSSYGEPGPGQYATDSLLSYRTAEIAAMYVMKSIGEKFMQHGLKSHYRVWYEIISPFPNFNGAVWEKISNLFPLLDMVLLIHVGIKVKTC